jgi:hypothetical protein
MKSLLIAIAVTLSSSLAMGEPLEGVGSLTIDTHLFSVENYISYDKKIPLQCKGVEDQLILKGYKGRRYTRKWFYEVVGKETPYIVDRPLQECTLVTDNAPQLKEQAYQERREQGSALAIGVGIVLALLFMPCLFETYLRDRFKRSRRY